MLFRSKEAETIEAVRLRLERAKEDVRAAEGALHDMALEAALSDDPNFAAEAAARLRQAREHQELVETALRHAEAREARRIAEATADLRKSQNASIRQHIAAIEKDAKAIAAAFANYTSAYRRLVEHGEAIVKLLPPNDASGFASMVSETAFRKAVLIELGRYAARPGVVGDPVSPPAAHYMPAELPPGCTYACDVEPLAQRLKTLLLRQYDFLVGKGDGARPAPSPELEEISPTPKPLSPSTAEPVPIMPEMIEAHGAVLKSAAAELLGA